ncbi:MAG: N-acetyltransferase family protein [Rhodobacterales bacterium]|nr:N-acetyltransferase family protein [Rhodobacterales bacterium]
MIIRDCCVEDVQGVADIWNPLIRTSVATFNSVEKTKQSMAGEIATRQAAGHAYLVAEAAGQVLGFATYGQFRGGIGYAHTMEHTIHLGAAAQGRGVGRALMAALEDHARAAGVHSLFAGISAENAAGIGFHRALGYREVTTLCEVGYKFGRWFDLVLMQKIL